MGNGIIHKISKIADLGTSGQRQIANVWDELPTVADLVLPGSGHSFSDESAFLLKLLGGERESA